MSREAFEEWLRGQQQKTSGFRLKPFDVWQAAESRTALRCWNICHEVTEASSAKSNIEDAYPDAFKERE